MESFALQKGGRIKEHEKVAPFRTQWSEPLLAKDSNPKHRTVNFKTHKYSDQTDDYG